MITQNNSNNISFGIGLPNFKRMISPSTPYYSRDIRLGVDRLVITSTRMVPPPCNLGTLVNLAENPPIKSFQVTKYLELPGFLKRILRVLNK